MLDRIPTQAFPILAFLVAGAGGCASTDLPTSGILGDYSNFKARGDALLVEVVAEPEDLKRYKRIMLDPVLVYLHPDVKADEVMPADQRTVKMLLKAALLEELGRHYDVTTSPLAKGPDVMEIRAALTNASKPKRTDEGVDLGSATIEVEVVDSLTGERLIAAVSQKGATRFTETREERRAEVERIFREWAVALRVWIDEATGRQ
jgi:hypothetical protein